MKSRFLLLAILAFILLPLGLYAGGADSLAALLVDLPGWSAEKAEGSDASYGDTRAIAATRSYENGDKRIDATIFVGMQVVSAWGSEYKEGFKVDTPEGIMEVKKIDGFLVYYGYEKGESAGGIMVLLQDPQKKADSGAVLAVEFEGLELEEALKIARTYDWSRMKAEVAKLN
jgi:hypothetical protein